MNRFSSYVAVLGVAAMLGACGKIPDPENGFDGGGDDDADAAPGPDATPLTGQATLVAHHDDGTPVGGATVVLTTHDGTSKMETTTGQDGKVVLDITEGDIASVGWNESAPGGTSRKLLFTVLALQVDDVVNLNNHTDRARNDLNNVVVQTPPLPSGASSATIDLGCTSSDVPAGQVSTTIRLRQDCIDSAGKFSVVADALDANGNTVFSAVKTDITPTSTAQTVVLTAWNAPGTGRITLSFANVPAAVRVSASLQASRHGVSYEDFGFDGTGPNPGTLTVVPAKGYADTLLRFAALLFPDPDDSTVVDGTVFMLAKEPYSNDSGASFTADFSKAMARLFKASYDATQHTFTWRVDTSEADQVKALRDADIAAIVLPWSDAATPNIQNQWTVLGPGTSDSPLQLDVHSLSTFAPPASAGTAMPVQLRVLDLDVVDGYKDAKTRFGSNFLDSVDTLPAFKGLVSFSGQPH